MDERDAYKLFRMGLWASHPVGTTLLTQGEPVEALSLIVDGEVSVEMDGKRVDTLGEGRFLGAIAFLNRDTHFTAPVTVKATAATRIIVWQFAGLDAQLVKDTNLDVAIEASLGLEIARFLQTARSQMLQPHFL